MRLRALGAALVTFGLIGCGQHPTSAPSNGTPSTGVAMTQPPTSLVPRDEKADPRKPGPKPIPLNYKVSKGGEPETYDLDDNYMVDASGNVSAIDPSKPVTNLPKLQSHDWSNTKDKTDTEIAANIDSSFKKLAGVTNLMTIHMILPIGEGEMKCDGSYHLPDQFYVQYPLIEGTPPHPQNVQTRVNKGQTVVYNPGRGQNNAYSAVGSFKMGGAMDGAEMLKNWPTDMPRLALSHFIVGKDAFTPLISALNDPSNGYHVATQLRTTEYNKRQFIDYRILADRPANEAKHLPAVQIEIVVDALHWVPVTMRTRINPGHGKKSTSIEWTASWGEMGKNYNPHDYVMPDSQI